MLNSAISPVSMRHFDRDFDGLSQELGTWFEKFGFAIVADHGFAQETIDDALAKAQKFFALPEEIKMAYKVAGGGGQRGYTGMRVETAKDHIHPDLKEFWHVGRNLPSGHRFSELMPPNVSVAEIDGWAESMNAFYDGFDTLGKRILQAIAHYLGLDRHWFDSKIGEGNSILRLLHYPPMPDELEQGPIRAGAHGDINVITLLLGADEPGLQLLDKAGAWLPVQAPKNCLAINIGDMLARLTSDRLPSTIHRVVNPSNERARYARYSMPFFLHFSPDVDIEPMAGTDGIVKYTPINSHDFLLQRLAEIKLT